MTLRWFPNSWVQLKTNNTVIYIDPAWIQKHFLKYPATVIYSHYPEPMDGLPDPELEKADLILITHHHKDHQKALTVKRLSKPDTVVIGTQKCRADLGDNIQTVKPGDELRVKDISVTAVYAYNTNKGRSTQKQHKKGECVGYVIEVDGARVYHAGDTDEIPEMRQLNNIDIAVLPIGGTFTMNIDEAINAALVIKPKVVIPIHWLNADPTLFERQLTSLGEVQVIVPELGKEYTFI